MATHSVFAYKPLATIHPQAVDMCVCNYVIRARGNSEIRHIVKTLVYRGNSGATPRSLNNRGKLAQVMWRCNVYIFTPL